VKGYKKLKLGLKNEKIKADIYLRSIQHYLRLAHLISKSNTTYCYIQFRVVLKTKGTSGRLLGEKIYSTLKWVALDRQKIHERASI